MTSQVDPRTGLETLFRSDCTKLLEPGGVGRVAITFGRQPMIFPVNFVMHSGAVVFRTATGTKYDGLLNGRAAFETDGVDYDNRTGWSVHVQGRCEEILDGSELRTLEALELVPWTYTEKPHWIRIQPEIVTGRSIPSCEAVRS